MSAQAGKSKLADRQDAEQSSHVIFEPGPSGLWFMALCEWARALPIESAPDGWEGLDYSRN